MPRPWREKVIPAGVTVTVDASAEDAGLLHLDLTLANFHSRKIRFKALQITEAWIGNASLQGLSFQPDEEGLLLPDQVAKVSGRAKISPAEVRAIRDVIQDPRAGCSHSASLKMAGRVTLRRGKAEERVEFRLNDVRPVFNLYYLREG